jgi:peptidoglycan/xylan/chitin deacetylase (PgdA/CDA1 family)
MEAMARVGLRGTAALDVHTAKHNPFLVDACRKAGWEFIGHGLVGNVPISSAMSEDEERGYIQKSLSLFESYTGVRPVGWLGPEFGESTRTPALLAEEGVRYVCDWPNDERPYAMTVPKGTLASLPILVELDDAFMIEQRRLTAWRWRRAVEEAADVMIADTGDIAPLMALSIHPWIMGQPHRIRFMAEALQNLAARGVWFATGRDVVEAAIPALPTH